MRAPAVPLAVAFALGALVPVRAPEGMLTVGGFLLAACGLACSLGWLARCRLGAASAAVVLAFACLGLGARGAREAGPRHPSPGLRELYTRLGSKAFIDPSRVEARLRHEPSFGRDAAVLTLEVEAIELRGSAFPTRGTLRASVGGRFLTLLEPLRAGDRVEVWGRLRLPRAFGNPNSFDVEAYLDRDDVDLYVSVKSARLVARLSKVSPFRGGLSRLRALARRRLATAFVSNDDGARETHALVLALVIGDRALLPPELERLYQRAGIFHVMAISGAHVAVLALLVHGALRRLGLDELPALGVLAIVLPFYAALCGAKPPVTRAVVMALLVVVARLASLDRPRLNALAMGALFLLIWEPRSLTDPGFQLSFAAMAGIVLLAEPLGRRLAFLGWFGPAVAASLGAQIGTLPLAAWHFHRLTPWAPVASLVAMPLASLLLVVGLVLAFVPALPGVTTGCVVLARGLAYVMTQAARLSLELPAASMAVPRPSLSGLALYGVALAAASAVSLLRGRPRRCAAVALSLTILFSFSSFVLRDRAAPPLSPTERALSVTTIDVGHGDSILLRLPDGGAVLVDGGGAARTSFDIGSRVVVPFLLDRGIEKLEAAVLTHADFDHLGGLFAVLEDLEVESLWEGVPRWERPAYRALRARARGRGIPVRRLATDESFWLGGAKFEILADGSFGMGRDENENARSLVMRVSFAGRGILLTGDAERSLEEHLLQTGVPLAADVVKLGHHGSRSSSTVAFLTAVAPQLALVSGRARPGPGWPIPSARVLHRLRSLGIEYLRTDTEGAITVSFDTTGTMAVMTHRATK